MSNNQHIPYPNTPSFHKFLYNKPAVRNCRFLGSVKLHGANITLICRPNQPVQIQSRNIVISLETENQGACQFFLSPLKPIGRLISDIIRIRGKGKQYTEIMIAGEYCGKGVQKGVAISELPKFFAIFNIRIDGVWVDMLDFRTVALPDFGIFNILDMEGCVFEVEIEDLQDEDAVSRATSAMNVLAAKVGQECPFAIAAGRELIGKPVKGQGEGIVWTLRDATEQQMELVNFKTKVELFSTTSIQPARPPRAVDPNMKEIEARCQAFLDFTCPDGGRRMLQGLEYLVEMHGGDVEHLTMDYSREFVKWIIQDTIKEEGWRLSRDFGISKPGQVMEQLSRRGAAWYESVYGGT